MKRFIITFIFLFCSIPVFTDDWNKTELKLKKLLNSKDYKDLEELEYLVPEIARYNDRNTVISFRLIVENNQRQIEELEVKRRRLVKELKLQQGDSNQIALNELSKVLNVLLRINSKIREKLCEVNDTSAIEWLLKEGLKSGIWVFREMVFHALKGVSSRGFDKQILERAKSETDSRVKITAIECLKERKIRADDFFIQCLKEKLWQVKSAAAEALGIFRVKDAITPLIESMKNETSILVLEAIANALFRITGRNLGKDYSKWAEWWKETKDKFVFPTDDYIKKLFEGLEKEKESDSKHTNTFFGIEITSTRICFVFDVSGSMAGPHEYKPNGSGPTTGGKDEELEKPIKGTKLDIAKYELKKVIKKLKKTTKFNIIFYSDNPKMWSEELLQATDDNKGKACRYIDKQIPNGGTNIYDSTEMAMNIGGLDAKKLKDSVDSVDTIYLLSDGLPTMGTFTNPSVIIEKLCELNKIRKIKIHTIAIGKDADASFMKKLAEETGGTFVKR